MPCPICNPSDGLTPLLPDDYDDPPIAVHSNVRMSKANGPYLMRASMVIVLHFGHGAPDDPNVSFLRLQC